MKFLILIIAICAIFSSSFADLEPPEQPVEHENTKPKSLERKSAKGLDEEETSKESNDYEYDEKFIKIIENDLNFPSAGIKIIKAPDLSKDNEGKKITEAISMMLENQEKWIQKIEEELEEINKNDREIPIEREKTAEEIEGKCMITKSNSISQYLHFQLTISTTKHLRF
jgi:hypothetical protein